MKYISAALLTWAICFTINDSLEYGDIPVVSHLFIIVVFIFGLIEIIRNAKNQQK
jgi:hypothetical protein